MNVNLITEKICPVCGGEAEIKDKPTNDNICVSCGTCGIYELTKEAAEDDFNPGNESFDLDKLASYLYYNKEDKNRIVMSRKGQGYDRHFITPEIVENWYPDKFSDKVDMFLLHLATKMNFFGEKILFTPGSLISASFLRRKPEGPMKNIPKVIEYQKEFFFDYLKKQGYVVRDICSCEILPEGLKRIDYLQKNNDWMSKNVFVAMSFKEDMKPIREAIKDGIIECGYIPRIMDEIEHNHQIIPEMLYEIRQAKFVIAELTGHNNGAYYEAGYAYGLKKEVIHLCDKSKFGEDGHFDVKQVNTVLWETVDDLKEKLIKRIKATIS